MKDKIIWSAFFTYKAGEEAHAVTGSINVAAYTIEEAIDKIQTLDLKLQRKVYKIEDIGIILE